MQISDWFRNLKGLFSSSIEQPAKVEIVKAWELTVEGKITELRKINIDKSGQNPRYQVYGAIDIASSELKDADFEVPKFLRFQGKETDLHWEGRSPVSVGDVVTLLFKGVDIPKDKFVLEQVIHND